MKNENVLLDKALGIVDKNRFSDKSYDKLLDLFRNTTINKRNNTKAIIKRDLSIIALFPNVVSMFSVMVMLVIVNSNAIDLSILMLFVLLFLYITNKMMLPLVEKMNYILNVIEDTNYLKK